MWFKKKRIQTGGSVGGFGTGNGAGGTGTDDGAEGIGTDDARGTASNGSAVDGDAGTWAKQQ